MPPTEKPWLVGVRAVDCSRRNLGVHLAQEHDETVPRRFLGMEISPQALISGAYGNIYTISIPPPPPTPSSLLQNQHPRPSCLANKEATFFRASRWLRTGLADRRGRQRTSNGGLAVALEQPSSVSLPRRRLVNAARSAALGGIWRRAWRPKSTKSPRGPRARRSSGPRSSGRAPRPYTSATRSCRPGTPPAVRPRVVESRSAGEKLDRLP